MSRLVFHYCSLEDWQSTPIADRLLSSHGWMWKAEWRNEDFQYSIGRTTNTSKSWMTSCFVISMLMPRALYSSISSPLMKQHQYSEPACTWLHTHKKLESVGSDEMYLYVTWAKCCNLIGLQLVLQWEEVAYTQDTRPPPDPQRHGFTRLTQK